jgi:DNA topoisomerase-1
VALSDIERAGTQTGAKRNVTRAIEQVAARLGNAVAVCRKSYIHPEVIAAYLDGSLHGVFECRPAGAGSGDLSGLRPEEGAVLALLRQRPGRDLQPFESAGRLTRRRLKKALRQSVAKESGARGAANPA